MPTRYRTRILTTAQIRKLESDFISNCDPNWGQVLMEIAGRGAAMAAYDLFQERKGTVGVFCGRGNNGGDGLVVARYLHNWGVPVTVWLVGSNRSRSAHTELAMTTVESSTNRDIVKKLGIDIRSFASDIGSDFFSSSEGKALASTITVIVDALLGTGLDRPVEGMFLQAIELINGGDATVVSVDVPTGINSDNGRIMGSAVRADATVTFGYLKPGLVIHPGKDSAGDIRLIDIGLPELEGDGLNIHLTTCAAVDDMLPDRPVDSHKGSFGYLLTIAGSLGMSGATLLAAESGLRSGAGLCILATPSSLVPHLPPGEIIYRPIAETDETTIAPKAYWDLEKDLDKATAIILGPGLSTNEETVSFVQKFLSKTFGKDGGTPCIIDADGLNCIARNTRAFPDNARNIVITPHPKELSRLLSVSTQEIQGDRVGAAVKAATEFGCTVVLKGAHSVIADPDGNVFINPTGNPGMATAGAGDVLSGVIGGLMAQGVPPLESAVAGAYLHGRAGDLAARELGMPSVVAGDLVAYLPGAFMSIQEGIEADLESVIRAY